MISIRTSLAVLAALSLCATSSALVNLQFRPTSQSSLLGAPVSVGVYGVATTTTDTLSAFDLYVTWSNSILGAITFSNVGSPTYAAGSGFTASAPPNSSLSDGDAYYSAFANFGSSIAISTTGTLLTTFTFTPTATGLASLSLANTSGTKYAGPPYASDAFDPNSNNVVGTLGTATINVQAVPEPTSVLALAAGVGVFLRRRSRR